MFRFCYYNDYQCWLQIIRFPHTVTYPAEIGLQGDSFGRIRHKP